MSTADDGVEMSPTHLPSRVRPSLTRSERDESGVQGLIGQLGDRAHAQAFEDFEDPTQCPERVRLGSLLPVVPLDLGGQLVDLVAGDEGHA